MSIDTNSILIGLGGLSGTIAFCTLYTNVLSYYCTKSKLIRIARKYGRETAQNFIEREEELYKSPSTNTIGGIGKKMVAKKYRDGLFDSQIQI